MSRERPPRTDIPRNLSFIAALTERAYYRSQRPSLEEESEEEPGEGGTRPGARSRAHVRDRGRRARSAPAGGSGARAARSRSPDTRKRVRFADALGLELAVVRRFRPGEPPRVPRHVQVQLQRDALRHFAPCPPRARGLQEARAALEPAREPGFAARLQAQRICLERADAGPLGVAGSARVLDLAYEKRVSVRWSADGWRSLRESPAAYAGPAPAPPRADRFSFRLPAPPVGGALLFALRYRVIGREFWDNNGGRDYALLGPEHPGGAGAAETQGWIHFI
ncbi:protein phosphatase 1 regulatory subunit 3E [Microtus pennsylvanicus]|uniref:Protein phosphatase 1 regulatory subunit 3E n=1 Tax=Microtus ochrogaster TaxID=79684 RepID=A0A8J6GET6_MICOH|nr:protein phosphatase 1 regulatory subunit 3E [Microtus ochrogaster]KAH0509652.1 Protein phosphatase 1 regulatory subunit 3E [Microtus ochrogaster]